MVGLGDLNNNVRIYFHTGEEQTSKRSRFGVSQMEDLKSSKSFRDHLKIENNSANHFPSSLADGRHND